MNKTVKTVLITLAAVFFVLVVIVMIFGDDPAAPDNSSSDVGESTLAVSDTSSSDESNEVINNDAGISQEEMNQTLAYDIFDWNGADDQGKLKIAQDIMRVWDANGSTYSMTAEELANYINQNLYDQANIYEIACTAEQSAPSAQDTASVNAKPKISQEEMNQTLAYDIFDWNGADDQGKLKIAQDIMMVWDAGGSVYSISAEGLVEFINQNLQDQANVFEVACTAENIDSSLYFGN